MRIDTLPVAGSLTLSTVAVTANQVITTANIGNLVFTPAGDANGAGYASFTFSVRDQSSAYDTSPNTMTVNVTATNDAPTGTNNTITINEDANHTFSASDFGFGDVDAGDTISAVRIDTVPVAGSLTLSGVAVTAAQVVPTVNIGNLVFTPALNANGTGYASFTFSVRDQSSVYDTSPNTITVDVTPLNDAPTGIDKTVTTNEDTGYTFSVSDFGFGDVDSGDTISAVRIDTIPAAGSLTLSGVAVTAAQVVTTANIGNLVFTPVGNANGASYASFTFSVRDQSSAYDTSPNTITVDVTATNDAPTGTNNTITINEDANHTFSTSDFGFGDADAGDTISAVRIDTIPVAGTFALSGVPVTAAQVITTANIGNLVFTPASNTNGTAYASFTFSVRDQSSVYDATPNTITIDVTALNDAPTGTDKTVTTHEDVAYTFSASDFGFGDIDSGDAISAVRIDTIPAAGTLALSGVAVTAAQVVTTATLGNLVFTPVPNANGTPYASFTFSVRDQSSAYDTAPNTITVDVLPAPTIVSVTVPSAGSRKAGDALDFTVNFSVAVTVTGTPRIALTLGASTCYATYVSGTGTTALVFSYTVLAGDNDTDGIAMTSPLELNGGTIIGAAPTIAAKLGFTAPTTSSVLVDTAAPTITSGSSASASYGVAFSGYTIAATDAATITYGASSLPPGLAVNTSTGAITGTPTTAGSYSTTISAIDVAGNVTSASVAFTVNKITPTITWSAPTAIVYGTALSATQLNATASIAGTMSYTPATGSVPAAGSQTLNVTFTPTDTTNYNLGAGSVTLTVTPASLTVTGVTAANKVFDGTTAATLTTTSAALVGVLAGDSVTLVTGGASGAFATAVIGTAKTVTVSGLSLAGAAASNYTLVQPTTTASITSGTAAITFDGLDQVYTGETRIVTPITVPAGLTVTTTYNGASSAPTGAGTYTVVATIVDATYTGTATATLIVARAEQTISFAPIGTPPVGVPVALSATATSGLPVTFSLVSGDATVTGATLTTHNTEPLTVRAIQAGDANFLPTGRNQSANGINDTRLYALSARVRVGTGGDILIPGILIGGTGTRQVIVRAGGPAIQGVSGTLARPQLRLHQVGNPNPVATNTGWSSGSAAETAALQAAFNLTNLPQYPVGSADCALLATVSAGSAYTATISGVDNTTGIALVEVYEVGEASARMTALSCRAHVGTGDDVLIAGLIVLGASPKQMIVRAKGPGLEGVPGVLARPTLALFDGAGRKIAENTGWTNAANAAVMASSMTAVGLSPLGADSADCAILMTLPPGGYTTHVSGAGGTTGVALIEIYEMP